MRLIGISIQYSFYNTPMDNVRNSNYLLLLFEIEPNSEPALPKYALELHWYPDAFTGSDIRLMM